MTEISEEIKISQNYYANDIGGTIEEQCLISLIFIKNYFIKSAKKTTVIERLS